MNHSPEHSYPIRISIKNSLHFFTDPRTRISKWEIFQFSIVGYTSWNNRISWTGYEYFWEFVSNISCDIPIHHTRRNIGPKYLWNLFLIFFFEISCLIERCCQYISIEKCGIDDYLTREFFCCKTYHIFTRRIWYKRVFFVISLPCWDDDDSFCSILEKCPDDTSVILMWGIECSSVHDIFVCVHNFLIKCCIYTYIKILMKYK